MTHPINEMLLITILFAKIFTGSTHHHYILPSCAPPNICTALSKCNDAKLAFCTFGTICCTIGTNQPTRFIRTNGDDVIDHRNFGLLPLGQCGAISSRFRITSGVSSSLGEFPWMALIAYKTGNSTKLQDFKCAGTLITEKFVLTAAHCVQNYIVAGVRLGEYNIATDPDCLENGLNCQPPCQDFQIQKLTIHEFYDPATFKNDIALIQLATLKHTFRPICLPFDELLDLNLENTEMVVSGWGVTESGTNCRPNCHLNLITDIVGDKSLTLRKVKVPVIPTVTCQKLYENLKPIWDKQICAGADHGRDSCAGDSGGPLKRVDFINNRPRYVQYGIVSFGPSKCGLSSRPGIYTNIQKYMTWILDHLE